MCFNWSGHYHPIFGIGSLKTFLWVISKGQVPGPNLLILYTFSLGRFIIPNQNSVYTYTEFRLGIKKRPCVKINNCEKLTN